MLMKSLILAMVAAILMVFAFGVQAQQMPNPYGGPVTLEIAKKVVTAAAAEARKNSWTMAFAVADPAGNLVYFEKLDNTQTASINIAITKARSAATFKRPTKTFQDAVTGGNNTVLGLPGTVTSEGGIPIVIDGKIVGAIGTSGGTGQQDGVASQAGINALLK
jgi:glc operon protein GlcG